MPASLMPLFSVGPCGQEGQGPGLAPGGWDAGELGARFGASDRAASADVKTTLTVPTQLTTWVLHLEFVFSMTS